VVLIQILLPRTTAASPLADGAFARTRAELVEQFHGVTAYLRSPAIGVWTSPDGEREQDEVVMVEVVTKHFDRPWWKDYTARLAERFEQEAIHVRALHMEILDDDAV
jgi:hypothetical protein